MKPSPKKSIVEELEQQVRYHNKRYFQENAPEISDIDFDKLVRKLTKLSPSSPVLTEIPDSLKLNTFEKVERTKPMLSLQKCYTKEELLKWSLNFEGSFIATAKVDGCAIELLYDEKGELVLAATRGNGLVGEDVTLNARMIEDIPTKIEKGPLEIRGEVYMRRSVFERFKDEFSNPRNLAAGGLRQKSPRECAKYDLSFVAYDIIGLNEIGLSDLYEYQKFHALEDLGFQTPLYHTVTQRDSLEFNYDFIASYRGQVDYEMDGVVFKASSKLEQSEAGFTSHHPRYSIAYKFDADSKVTEIEKVIWQVSKNGRITPVGIVKPVQLSGAIVTRFTLHNYNLFQELALRQGSQVRITRSGGVIPYFEEVVSLGTGEQLQPPSTCPACSAKCEVIGEFLVCQNDAGCVAGKLQRLEHYLATIQCDGFGPSMIERLYNAGLVKDIPDFYRLEIADLTKLEGVGEILAAKLLKNLQETSSIKLETFLSALSVPLLGKQTAKLFVKQFKNLETIMGASYEEAQNIPGVGEVTAKTIKDGLRGKIDMVIELLDYVQLQTVDAVEKPQSPILGKSFLFTGSLVSMARDKAEASVEQKGGNIGSSVTKDLDYLVVGDAGGAGSKLEKAVKLQERGGKVQVITETVWLNLMNRETLSL